MRKFERRIMVIGTAIFALHGQFAMSTTLNLGSVPLGSTVDIYASDTAILSGLNLRGTVNNHGLMKESAPSNVELRGTLNNDGNIFFESYINAGPLSLTNHPDGYIVMTNYIDAYQQSTIENAGTLVVANSLGDGIYLGPKTEPFTYMFQGIIHNTGKILINRKNSPGFENVCQEQNRIMTVRNEGYFEIASGSLCDWGSNPQTQITKATYVQDRGETRIDGTFGAHEIAINKGVLSGIGTIQGNFNNSLSSAVTVSPGAPLGTLTIAPDGGNLICLGCSVSIELAGNQSADQFHVDGNITMNGWNLNVQLRDGYLPAVGTNFTVVSANLIYYWGMEPTYNLPKLPDGRTWSVQNTGTEVILTAN